MEVAVKLHPGPGRYNLTVVARHTFKRDGLKKNPMVKVMVSATHEDRRFKDCYFW